MNAMGRGARTTTASSTSSASPARRGGGSSDPIVAHVAAVLAGEARDRDLYENLQRRGLVISVPGLGLRPSRLTPSTLGQIVADKRRLPTPTEIRRVTKQLDAELKRNGVVGVVTASSYSYTQPPGDAARARQQKLISDRKAVAAFTAANDLRHFEGVRIANAQARAAQAKLLAALEKAAENASYKDGLLKSAAKLRSGVISVADADSAMQQLASWTPPGSDEELAVEALRIGLGLPTARDRLIQQADRQARDMRSLLDEVDAGKRPVSDDGNVEWSSVRVADRRVKRAAFGYNAPAAQLGADYYHHVIIELHDGTIDSDEVKRAHSDLEPYVDSFIEQRSRHEQGLKDAAALEQRAHKLLRRWARS